jgi:hypothetical protein
VIFIGSVKNDSFIQTIPCQFCDGTGRVGLSGVYLKVLRLLRKRGSLTSADIRSSKESFTAANNRLEYLRKHGFATRKKESRLWVYTPATPPQFGKA